EVVEAPLYKIENIQHDSRIPFSGPGGRRFKSSLPDQYCQSVNLSFINILRDQGVSRTNPYVPYHWSGGVPIALSVTCFSSLFLGICVGRWFGQIGSAISGLPEISSECLCVRCIARFVCCPIPW